MPENLSMSEARERLTRLPEQFAGESNLDAIAITRRGRPVLAVLPWDLYESIRDTLEIVGDEALMAELRAGLAEAAAGKTVPWETVKDQLAQ